MFKENSGQLTIGEHLIYQNLPEDILSRINKLIEGNLFYRRFLGLSAVDPVPNYSTISRFRPDLKP